MQFLAYDDTENPPKLYLVNAANCEKAIAVLADLKTGSDGDEFSIAKLERLKSGKAVEIKGLF